MSTRRDFFKQFVGQMVELKYDMMGVERTPLNRLHELPEEIIEEIEPMLFPKKEIHIVNHISSVIVSSKLNAENQLILNEFESAIFRNFGTGKVLKEIALIIAANYSLSFQESFIKVKALFLQLAGMRICHPREFYDINDLKKRKNEDLSGNL